MKAYRHEREAARKEGVILRFQTLPVEVLGEDGKVKALKCVSTRMEGNQVVPVPGTEFEIPADHIFFAIGQLPHTEFFQSIPGLKTDSKGRVITQKEGYQTENPKVFAGGDCLNGGKEVVNGVQHGRDAAREIHTFLSKN
ncbi:MAG: hypothetical protein D6785_09915 [Planctomycetota bacterium]|nr:MAG: hypothetical protein D6785_09915 [Planctomycetota bacterium]